MKAATLQSENFILPRDLYRRCCEGAPVEIIDVRTPPEFLGSHVAGASSVPLQDLDVAAFFRQRRDPEAPLYIICQSGARAAKAREKFRRAGFDHCVLVEGGVDGWTAAGLPLERGATRVLPLAQQVHLVIGISSAVSALLALTLDKWFAAIPLVTGCGLIVNGITGWCGLGLLLAKLPWNRRASDSENSCCNVL